MDGQKLRETRIQRGLSQRELAEAVGTHQTTVSKIERLRWEPPEAVAEGIARALGVAPGDLAGNGSVPQHPTAGRSKKKPGKEPTARTVLTADDPRVRALLERARSQRRPGAPSPTLYRCPYCREVTHTDVSAVRHALACDENYPGYTEWYGRYVDLSEAAPDPRSLRAASGARVASGGQH